jgi:hypothetical protein
MHHITNEDIRMVGYTQSQAIPIAGETGLLQQRHHPARERVSQPHRETYRARAIDLLAAQ